MQFLAQSLLTTNAATGKILDIFKATGTVTYYTQVKPISNTQYTSRLSCRYICWW